MVDCTCGPELYMESNVNAASCDAYLHVDRFTNLCITVQYDQWNSRLCLTHSEDTKWKILSLRYIHSYAVHTV